MSQQLDPLSDLMNAGSDIMKSVDQALSSGDFSHLSSDIGNSIRNVTKGPDIPPTSQRQYRQDTHENSQEAQSAQGTSHSETSRTYRYTTSTGDATEQRWQYATHKTSTTRTYSGLRRNHRTPFLVRKPSPSSGKGKCIVGTFFAVVNGIYALCSLILIPSEPQTFLTGFFVFAAVTGGFWYMAHRGRREKQLVDRFYQYANIIGPQEYFSISQLATQTGRSEEEVVKDLQDMMIRGWLPQARMDAQHTTLMLTQDVYNQYINMQKDQMEQQRQESARKAAEDAMSPAQRQYQRILEEGQSYINDIHRANDAIPDEVMSDKLYRLEDIMRRIFTTAKEHPDSASDLRRLMDYYLPTTDKLLKAYIDLDQQPYGGENIDNTKKQIEDAMDTINDAFEQLLDSMYADMAWDVSSDISVMKTMLRQDGLAGDDLMGSKTGKDQKSDTSYKAAGNATSAPQFGATYSDPDFSKEAENILESEQSGGSAKAYEPHLTFGSDADTKKS